MAFVSSGDMSAYYNEIDPYAAAWLHNLIAAGHIAPGDVDERDIQDVRPEDLRGYSQHHFSTASRQELLVVASEVANGSATIVG